MTDINEAVPLAPCDDWCTVNEVADCCDLPQSSDNAALFETAVSQATGLLSQLSGNRFIGICERTVRPCPGDCTCWSRPWRGYWPGHETRPRGCKPLSTVKLAGYPVQTIVEVLIDDAVVAADEYRLNRHRDLVRLNDVNGLKQYWPGCQDLGKKSGEDTFFVTYTYGLAPPVAGVEAAKQLACELVKACAAETAGDCDLPSGVTRVTRQGIVIEAQTLGLFLTSGQSGLAHVDAFLAAYGSAARRPAVLWTPDIAPYAQEA